MLKYNVEIILAQLELSKKTRQLEVFDMSLEEAFNYVKCITEKDTVLDARVTDETGRQIKLPNF